MNTLRCEVIARAVLGLQVSKKGQELLWRCPNHDDHDPSLAINSNKNCFGCFVCGVSGGPWKLAAFLAGLDPNDKAVIAKWLREHGLPDGIGNAGRKPTAIYPYHDEQGGLLYEILR